MPKHGRDPGPSRAVATRERDCVPLRPSLDWYTHASPTRSSDMLFRTFLLLATIASFAPSALAAPLRGVFDQRLDPSNPSDLRTFRQRFIVDSDNASGPDAPVVYFLGNE